MFLVDYYYLFVIILSLIFIFFINLREIYVEKIINIDANKFYYKGNVIYAVFNIYKVLFYFILLYFTFGFVFIDVLDLSVLIKNIFLLTKFIFFIFILLFLFLLEFYIKLVN